MSKDILTAKEFKDMYGIDLAQAEVIRNALIQTTRHMSHINVKGAYSTVIRDMMDMGHTIVWIGDEGYQAVAASEGCRQFSVCHAIMTAVIFKDWGLDNIQPGDIVICNDPYRGGIHQADLNIFTPVFHKEKPVFIMCAGAHFMDVGGPARCGMNPVAQSIYEEPIRLSPMLVYARGIPVRSTVNLLVENSRLTMYMIGDLRALCGSLLVGAKRMEEIINTWGLEAVVGATKYAIDRNERLMRKAIREIPDGVYEAADYVDDDGVDRTKPVKINCRITVKGDRMELDFSGTSVQGIGPKKTALIDGGRAVLGVKFVLDPENPDVNAGTLKPIDVILPKGSALCALPPASISDHMDIGDRAMNAVDEALSRALPDRGIACGIGTCGGMIFGGLDTRPGRNMVPWGFGNLPSGAWGGTAKGDGNSFCGPLIGNMRDCVVEFVEQECPVVITSREAFIDCAGAGKYRSGFSTYITTYLLSPALGDCVSDRARFAPPGEFGGGPGSPTFAYRLTEPFPPTWRGITPLKYMKPVYGVFDKKGRPNLEIGKYCQGAEETGSVFINFPFDQGGVYRQYTASGGGYGDPLERDPELVRLDVWNEWITNSFARKAYGVIINQQSFEVDIEATRKEREKLRKQRDKGKWKTPAGIFYPWPLESLDEIDEVKES